MKEIQAEICTNAEDILCLTATVEKLQKTMEEKKSLRKLQGRKNHT